MMSTFFSFTYVSQTLKAFVCEGGPDGGSMLHSYNTEQSFGNKIIQFVEIESQGDIERAQIVLEKEIPNCVEGSLKIINYRLV